MDNNTILRPEEIFLAVFGHANKLV
jgi:hypothetical protein